MDYFHLQRNLESTAPPDNRGEHENLASGTDSAASLVVLSPDPVDANTCDDCGKIFKQIPHLRRHKRCVHANKRPYCCLHCRRTFSQASGLVRHQLIHRKRTVVKETGAPNQSTVKVDSLTLRSELADPPEELKETNLNKSLRENMDLTDVENTSAGDSEMAHSSCSDCGKSFSSDVSLRKHKVIVHKRLRPYVCTLCRKCFGQYSDLTRHLQRHKKRGQVGEDRNAVPEEPTTMPFRCANCSLTFPSVDILQQHINEHHSTESKVINQEDDMSHDPDIPQSSEAETVEPVHSGLTQRPQRLGAQSRISAITKRIAPKRRATICTKPLTSTSQTKRCSANLKAPDIIKYKWFSCNRCKRTYSNPDKLKAHRCILQHRCGQCGETFTKSDFLKRHEQTVHLHAKTYTCDRCRKAFVTLGNLRQHQKSNTCVKYHCTSEIFSCSSCLFSFTMKSYLIKHIKKHHPEEYLSLSGTNSLPDQQGEEQEEHQYICPQCGKRYISVKGFKSHSCLQQVNVLYLCTDCGKGFTNQYGLKLHQRIHTGEKPYKCPHCSKSFSYTGQLSVHLRTHTGEKPYLCTHCGESFRQSGDLKRHERKHTGVKPFNCPECGKSFSRLQSLKAHQMIHLGQKMFKCNQCGKSFSRNYHLRRHHQKMHL